MSKVPPLALIRNIERAFADVEYPGDAQLSDSYGDEAQALRLEFRGKNDWRALDPAFLNQAPAGWGSALSFFSDRAFRFYLPAYLIADVRGQLDTPSVEHRLCWGVTPQAEHTRLARVFGGGTIGDRAHACFAGFDGAQVAVIVDYLWWKLDQSDGYDPVVEQALEHYWLKIEVGPR